MTFNEPLDPATVSPESMSVRYDAAYPVPLEARDAAGSIRLAA